MTVVEDWLRGFDEADTAETGFLTLEQFRDVYAHMEPDGDEGRMLVFFRGMDLNGDGLVSRGEMTRFATALAEHDETELLKVSFRAFDLKRRGRLGKAEIARFVRTMDITLTEDDIAAGIERIGGPKAKTLNFAQTMKLVADEDLPDDTDPYDGMLSVTKKATKKAKKEKKSKKKNAEHAAEDHGQGGGDADGDAGSAAHDEDRAGDKGDAAGAADSDGEQAADDESEANGEAEEKPQPGQSVAEPAERPPEEQSKCCLLL